MDNILFSYFDPEKESFKNFIFRDSHGLYQFDGVFPLLKKKYLNKDTEINIYEYNGNLCQKLKIKQNELLKCEIFLKEILIELKNGKELKSVLGKISELINNDTEFFDLSKEEIYKMDFNLVFNILKNLNFKIKRSYSPIYYRYANYIEPVKEWFSNLSQQNQNILMNIPIFLGYLQLLVDYINLNPNILNDDWSEFDEKLFYLKHLEEYLNKNYNKSSIYNEILLGYIDNIEDRRTHAILYKYSKKFLDDIFYKGLLDSKILLDIFNDNKKTLENTFNFNKKNFEYFDKLLPKYVGYIKSYLTIEKKLIEKIEILIKYLLINPKNIKTKNMSFYEITEQINLFLKLKKDLHYRKTDFIEKYPRNKFIF
jgi:hypothetical protein